MKERIKELEVLRAFAFIFVVLQHALGSAPNNKSLSFLEMNSCRGLFIIAESAVPIFLFLSGLTAAYNYKKDMDIKKYYKNKLLYLILPYFIWSFVNMLWYNPDRLSNFFVQTVGGNGCFHLWYMGMFIRLTLIMPLFIYIGRFINKKGLLIRGSFIILGYIGCYHISKYQWKIVGTVRDFIFNGDISPLGLRILNISFLFWAIYVFLGLVVGFNYEKIRTLIVKYKYVIFIAFIYFFMYKFSAKYNGLEFNRNKDIFYRFSNIFLFTIISIKMLKYKKVYKVMEFISIHSFVGYLIHIKVLYCFIFMLRGLGLIHPLWNAIVSTIFAVAITPVLIYFMRYIPNSKILTGIKPIKADYNLFTKNQKVEI